MTPSLSNDEKLETIFQFIEKTKQDQKKEKWMLRGLIIGLIVAAVFLMVILT